MGLAVGDALGQPTEGWTPEAVRETWGYIDGFVEDAVVSDDTEYTLFSAKVFLEHGVELKSSDVAGAWLEHLVPLPGPFKGAGFSEMAAIENLRRGVPPPMSGRHYHSWSDGLAMRVAPCGILAAGDPAGAARLAYIDGCVSHAGEGIYAGQAVAAAIATAVVSGDLPDIAEAMLQVVPEDSWTARNLRLAHEIAAACPDGRSAIGPLHDALAVSYYPWTDLGPEAVGLALGLLIAGKGDVRESVLAAVNLGRDADTVAAIVGSILGAQQGLAAVPEGWRSAMRPASGTCLAVVRGLDLIETADALVALREET